MAHKNLIITFTRNPELGKVKTRLAKTIGETSALAIYIKLLEHTESVLRNIDSDKAVYYSVKIRENDLWDSNRYQKHQQFGDDLGIRMQNAFKAGFDAGYNKIVIVGSDLHDLQPKHITQAFEVLDTNDVTIGPAEDGGYYLLGMKTLHKDVFENKNWGTETVFDDTIKNLKNESVFLLEQLNDVDTYEDIKNNHTLKALIEYDKIYK